MKIRRDSIDLCALREVQEHAGFRLITERIEKMTRIDTDQLKTCAPEQLARLQGRIAALETVLQLPAILYKEIREKESRTPAD
jgi:hypothetical protein